MGFIALEIPRYPLLAELSFRLNGYESLHTESITIMMKISVRYLRIRDIDNHRTGRAEMICDAAFPRAVRGHLLRRSPKTMQAHSSLLCIPVRTLKAVFETNELAESSTQSTPWSCYAGG